MLEYQNVSIKTKDKNITDNISFTLEKGKIVAIVGESGGGKTMTSLSIMGLLPKGVYMEGSILKDGTFYGEKERRKALGCDIMVIPQCGAEALNPMLKIKTQMKDSIRKEDKKDALGIMENALKKAGFDNPIKILNSYPHELSGGMAQRVSLAMALLSSFSLLICDEPTNGMNDEDVMFFTDFLRTNFKDREILFITHDMNPALKCDEIFVLKEGKMVLKGTKDDILSSSIPYVKELLKAGGIYD